MGTFSHRIKVHLRLCGNIYWLFLELSRKVSNGFPIALLNVLTLGNPSQISVHVISLIPIDMVYNQPFLLTFYKKCSNKLMSIQRLTLNLTISPTKEITTGIAIVIHSLSFDSIIAFREDSPHVRDTIKVLPFRDIFPNFLIISVVHIIYVVIRSIKVFSNGFA